MNDLALNTAERIYDKYAEFYDVCAAAGRGDIDMYKELAIGRGPIIDIGCGTGRIALELIAEGHDVIGIDISQRMLDLCLVKCGTTSNGTLRLFRHDLCQGPLTDVTAGVAILSWFTFNYAVTDADQRSLLLNVHHALHDGGLIALDLFYPKALACADGVWEDEDRVLRRDPLLSRSDRRVMSGPVEHRRQAYRHGAEAFTFESRRRYVSPGDIDSLLHSCGFTVEWFSFDHGRSRLQLPDATAASSFVVVARKSPRKAGTA